MPEIFDTGIKFLLGATFLFFLVLFYLCRSWSQFAHPEYSNRIGFIMGVFYSFIFFFGGFAIIALIFLSWENLVNLIKSLSF